MIRQPVNPGVLKKRLAVCQTCDRLKFGRCEANNKLPQDFARTAVHCPERRWPGDPPAPEPPRTSGKPSPAVQTPQTASEPPEPALTQPEPKEGHPGPQELLAAFALTPEEQELIREEHELISQPIPRNLTREAAPAEIRKVAILTCYFNPERYRRIRENYYRFREEMGRYDVSLFTVELAFDDDEFELDGTQKQIRGSRRHHKMWQKERLLNLLLDETPQEYDAIGWFDCDLLFMNGSWLDGLKETLSKYVWCQPYAGCWFTERDGSLTNLKRSMGWFLHKDPKHFLDFGKAHPGFAWVARADWLRKHRLYDTCITGGGDSLMVKAITEQPLFIEKWLNVEWLDDVDVWAAGARADGGRHFGYVPGDLIHLYHGSRAKRKYRSRWCYQTDYDFNPHTDLETDPDNGLLRWTEQARYEKPAMLKRVSEYFAARDEDGT